MLEIGVAETRAHVNALNERLIAGVDDLGGDRRHAARRRSAAARSSASARRMPRLWCAALGQDGIVTSERDCNLRVSAHAYNNESTTSTPSSPRSPATAPCCLTA